MNLHKAPRKRLQKEWAMFVQTQPVANQQVALLRKRTKQYALDKLHISPLLQKEGQGMTIH